MNYLLRALALLLLAGLLVPLCATASADDQPDAKKPSTAKKDDPDKKDNSGKSEDKKAKDEPAKKDDKNGKDQPAKKDGKDQPAKKDDKADAAKKKDGKTDDAKKESSKKKDERVNTEKTIKAGQLTGKIVAVEVTKRTLRLSIDIAVPVPDQSAVNAAANFRIAAEQYLLAAQQPLAQYQQLINQAQQATTQAQQALAKKDKNGYSQNIAQAAQYQSQAATYQTQAAQFQALAAQQKLLAVRQESNLYRNDTKHREIEVSMTEDAKVRLASPPDVFDDKGKKRRMTSKELKEAKGEDPKLPGYQADFSSLREEQIITATLVKSKDPPKLKAAAKKDADAGLLAERTFQASMIMIVADPPPAK